MRVIYGGVLGTLRLASAALPPTDALLADHREEPGSNVASDCTRHAGPNHATIALDDGNHLGCGPCEKTLIRNVDIVARQRRFADGQRCGATDFHDRFASDPFQNTGIGGWCKKCPIA